MQKIIIVESPSKSKTIESYMGSDYKVLSSVGHIRDLSTKGPFGLGIDIDNDFKPDYTIIKGKNKIVSDLKKACKGHEVYLATDPDREGEAISYHLAQVLDLDLESLNRIEFHEITKPAIKEAFNNPRKIDMNLVSSQETRRMLDRIIGFKVSKLLQSRIKSQSAGRVQSVALKLVVDLEDEINNFISTPYYELEALFDGFKLDFVSYKNDNKRIIDKEYALKIYDSLDDEFVVSNIENKTAKRESKPPYTTSTLQQDASNKLGFQSSKTMRIAQWLYEGKKIGNEEVGLITYMRTDSTHLSNVFINDATNYIKATYGQNYVGFAKEKKQVNAQEAHEAIRPTSITRLPESVKPYLTLEEYKLYKLIYERTLSSLMKGAIFQKQIVTFKNNDTLWNITGQTLVFDGYLKIYKDEDEINTLIPSFKEGEKYKALEVKINELFTKPKSRYTEATLIKDMERLGIGRPSTYAQTMTTLRERKYIEVHEKKLVPTEQGIITSKSLDEYFSDIFNVKYTANMERELDQIAKGELQSKESLHEFYQEFEPIYENASNNMASIYPKPTGEICPSCGNELVIRKGKYGEFIACSNYPKCKYIKQNEAEDNNIDTGITCPKCLNGTFIKKMALKGKNKGSYFYACSNYPKCKNILNEEPTNELCPKCGGMMVKDSSGKLVCANDCINNDLSYEEVLCPKCQKGYLVKRKALRGKNAGNYFYACSNFPRCKNVYNLTPTNTLCPKCGSIMLKDGDKLICSNEECK